MQYFQCVACLFSVLNENQTVKMNAVYIIYIPEFCESSEQEGRSSVRCLQSWSNLASQFVFTTPWGMARAIFHSLKEKKTLSFTFLIVDFLCILGRLTSKSSSTCWHSFLRNWHSFIAQSNIHISYKRKYNRMTKQM